MGRQQEIEESGTKIEAMVTVASEIRAPGSSEASPSPPVRVHSSMLNASVTQTGGEPATARGARRSACPASFRVRPSAESRAQLIPRHGGISQFGFRSRYEESFARPRPN